jgi:hypothetical protein
MTTFSFEEQEQFDREYRLQESFNKRLELLKEAISVLQDYPSGQDDGTWIKRKQDIINKYTGT